MHATEHPEQKTTRFQTWLTDLQTTFEDCFEIRKKFIPEYDWETLYNQGYDPETAITTYYNNKQVGAK
jgi:hypothetical protein